MAIIQFDFLSTELQMHTLVTMALPNSSDIGTRPLAARKVLYLLHGLSDDGTGWIRNTRIEKYALAHDLVVVMPSAGRSMYCDHVYGQNYFSHITKELPAYLWLVFGLSKRREDNLIAGLSMGGLGAMKMALTYPEQYFAVGSFSGVLDTTPPKRVANPHGDAFAFMRSSDPSCANPVQLLDADRHRALKIYVSCGLQDPLLRSNYAFRARADALGVEATYVFEDGTHEWGFWDSHVKRFLDFALAE